MDQEAKMDIVTLRRAGGSLTLTIPASLVRTLGLSEGAQMGVAVEGARLVATPTPSRPGYRLEDLLAQCDPEAPLTEEDRVWERDGPVGDELL